MNILEIKDLSYKQGNSIIFNNLNLKIKENSYTVIAGRNGSGKTTLIKIMSGEIPTTDNVVIGYSYLNANHIYDHSTDIVTYL